MDSHPQTAGLDSGDSFGIPTSENASQWADSPGIHMNKLQGCSKWSGPPSKGSGQPESLFRSLLRTDLAECLRTRAKVYRAERLPRYDTRARVDPICCRLGIVGLEKATLALPKKVPLGVRFRHTLGKEGVVEALTSQRVDAISVAFCSPAQSF